MSVLCSIYIHQIWFVNCVIHTIKIYLYLYDYVDDMKSVFEKSLFKIFHYDCGFIKSTCQLYGKQSIRAVNENSWKAGTVVQVRADGSLA